MSMKKVKGGEEARRLGGVEKRRQRCREEEYSSGRATGRSCDRGIKK